MHSDLFETALHLGILFNQTFFCASQAPANVLLSRDLYKKLKRKGDHVPIMFNNETYGEVLLPSTGTEMLYVSASHKISLHSAVQITDILTFANQISLPVGSQVRDLHIPRPLLLIRAKARELLHGSVFGHKHNEDLLKAKIVKNKKKQNVNQ